MNRTFLRTLVVLIGSTFVSAIHAATVYTNGPINDTATSQIAIGISSPASVSDSFTLTGTASLISATLGLVTSGGAPLALSWEIGTSPFASNIGSGTSTLTNVVHATGLYAGSDYDSSFALSGLMPGAGTYYLSVFNATGSSGGTSVYWIENNGPSTASFNYSGSTQSIPSEAFTLLGTRGPATAAVPDAGSSLLLLCLGVSGLLLAHRLIAA